MLEINLKCEINNVNYLKYMEYKENENGVLKELLEREQTTKSVREKNARFLT